MRMNLESRKKAKRTEKRCELKRREERRCAWKLM